MPKKVTLEAFLRRSKEKHGDFYDYSKVKFVSTLDKIIIICPIHGEFLQRVKHHLRGYGCRECGNLRVSDARSMTYEDFVKRANEIHGQYEYVGDSWSCAANKIIIICRKHGSFKQTPHAHLRGSGCPECGLIKRSLSKRLTTAEAIKIFRSVHGDLYDYSKFVHTTHHGKSIIICSHHGEFLQSTSNHRAGKGCPECKKDAIGNALRKPVDEVIKDFKNVHGEIYDYSLVPGDYNTANEEITIICKEHGEFTQIPYNHLMGKGCPKCRESGGERQIRRVLERRMIHFVYEWNDHDCKVKRPLKFDFYLPELNALIEYDGEQHFDADARWWSTDKEKNQKDFEALKERDRIKTEWAIKNGFTLLRIRFDDALEESLEDFLDELLLQS